MNGRKIKEKISLRHFLTRNILILIFAAIIIAAVTLFAGNSLGSALVKQPDVSVVLNQSSIYEKEDYKSVKAGSSLGENGYYQILDENANLLYTSDKTKANSLTLESLDYVPDAANGTIFTIELQKNEYGEDYYFIHRIYTDSNNNVETGLAVIDINQNILYSNMEINSSKISQNTINILLNNSEDGLSQTVAQKHRFETQSGKIRYLILYTDSDTAIYITEYMRANHHQYCFVYFMHGPRCLDDNKKNSKLYCTAAFCIGRSDKELFKRKMGTDRRMRWTRGIFNGHSYVQ